MPFEIVNPTDEIVFVRWYRKPNREEAFAFLDAFWQQFDAASHKMYAISDVRDGHIDDVEIINKLSQIAHHPNFGAGVAFGGSFSAAVYVNLYERLTHSNVVFTSLQGALDELERIKPGVTRGVEWDRLI